MLKIMDRSSGFERQAICWIGRDPRPLPRPPFFLHIEQKDVGSSAECLIMHLGSYDIKFYILFAFSGWFAVPNFCVNIVYGY